jgi:hypothetical protein
MRPSIEILNSWSGRIYPIECAHRNERHIRFAVQTGSPAARAILEILLLARRRSIGAQPDGREVRRRALSD